MPIVNGIEAFRNAMATCNDTYVLIGGGACSILFDEVGEQFRLTKDLDIVILTDGQTGRDFAQHFWRFVRDGGYMPWQRTEGRCTYYRFNLPKNSPNALKLPEQIELFARHPDFKLENEGLGIAPLPFDQDISSLSAIILDDGYFEFIRNGIIEIDGVPLLDPLHIIPLKMRAHIDLNDKHQKGQHVNEKDLTKHRKDVARLSRLLTPNNLLPLVGDMRADAKSFLEDLERYANQPAHRKQRQELLEDLQILKRVYL